jgi:hypothetical protein
MMAALTIAAMDRSSSSRSFNARSESLASMAIFDTRARCARASRYAAYTGCLAIASITVSSTMTCSFRIWS